MAPTDFSRFDSQHLVDRAVHCPHLWFCRHLLSHCGSWSGKPSFSLLEHCCEVNPSQENKAYPTKCTRHLTLDKSSTEITSFPPNPSVPILLQSLTLVPHSLVLSPSAGAFPAPCLPIPAAVLPKLCPLQTGHSARDACIAAWETPGYLFTLTTNKSLPCLVELTELPLRLGISMIRYAFAYFRYTLENALCRNRPYLIYLCIPNNKHSTVTQKMIQKDLSNLSFTGLQRMSLTPLKFSSRMHYVRSRCIHVVKKATNSLLLGFTCLAHQ